MKTKLHFGGEAQDFQIILFTELSRHRPKDTGTSGVQMCIRDRLVLRIFADDHNAALAFDDLAFFADFFD